MMAGTAQGSAVTKVIELLGELKVKVEKDLKAETGAMNEYLEFCDDEQTAKGYAIETAAKEIDGYKAVIEQTTGNMQELQSTIDSSGAEVSKKTEELASATGVRKTENEDFKAAEKELVDSIDMLGRAVTLIKRATSFAQTGKDNSSMVKQIKNMSTALMEIISAAGYASAESKAKVESFLSTQMDDELTFKVKQPQAATYAYESHSGSIVETLENMKDEASSTLKNVRKEEMKAKHAFELIKQSLNDAVANLNKLIETSKADYSAAEEKLGKAQGDLSSTEASKKSDESYLSKLTSQCNAKSGEWDARKASAKAEIEALAKGVEILSAKFSFIQSSVVKKSKSGDVLREKAVSVLKKLGRKFNSFAMMQIANAAGSDPFGKVRGLIESMIAKLEQQAQEEATHDSFCKEETAKTKKSKEEKSASVEKYSARIDEAKAGLAELSSEVSDLMKELKEISDATTKATKIRSEEKADFDATSKDLKESIEAVAQATVVLKDYYGSASFIQQGPALGAARSDASSMIIGVLTEAESDFQKSLAEAEATETEAVEAFEALIQANKVSKAEKEASVKAKESEMKSIEVALTHHEEDYTTTSGELDAVIDYMKKLKDQCTSKAMTYEERKAKREAEIAGLQEALTILSGDSASLIQKAGFLAKIRAH